MPVVSRKMSTSVAHATQIFVNGNPDYICCTNNFKSTFTRQYDDFSWIFFSDLKLGTFLRKLGKKILFGIENITE